MIHFVVGGAGFIGSNIVHKILRDSPDDNIIIYDNFSSGKMKFLKDIEKDSRLKIIVGDIKDLPKLTESMKNSDIVYLFASNPDISKAVKQPDIDFWEGTYLVQNVLEAMRTNGIKKIIYASGSGVYGDWGEREYVEDGGSLLPLSTYGASKLSGESLISAYCYMFDMVGSAYRFANVIGSNQTHGVGYDFIHQLIEHSTYLNFFGNGQQSKSYIHVEDIVDAIFASAFDQKKSYDYFNVATKDYLTVKEIADIAVNIMGLNNVEYRYLGNTASGWKGDIGIVRFNSDKIRSFGWENKYTSYQAMEYSIQKMLENKIWED
jgi:UDP-glucose 4-epimerase